MARWGIKTGTGRGSAPVALASSKRDGVCTALGRSEGGQRTVLAHLQALTWTFRAGRREIAAISVYAEPEETPGGVVYRAVRAAQSGDEGLACVDDVARAVVLALWLAEAGDVAALSWARRWLTFVTYMQLPDGRFANFVLDRDGRRNLDGVTSYPGGSWWTARALWALATAYRVLGEPRWLRAYRRCPPLSMASPPDHKVLGLLALGALELLDAPISNALAMALRRRVTGWSEQIIAGSTTYLTDRPGQERVDLWGYHQLAAIARAARVLGRPDFLPSCVATVDALVVPVVEGGFYYAYPGVKDHQCAYCISPLVQGLAELFISTGDARYRALALAATRWFYGANDAGAVLYDPHTGRCSDGLHGSVASLNCGAESAIEAGLAEIIRRRLLGLSVVSPDASCVSLSAQSAQPPPPITRPVDRA